MSREDLKWNNYTFTWYDNIQPMLKNTEIKLLKEKDSWIYKLREKRGKLSVRLSDCFSVVQEFKTRDKLFEAEQIHRELMDISAEIEEFNKEVTINLQTQNSNLLLIKKAKIIYFS